MFYELQPQIQTENYKRMLSIVGSLTQLFSESECPYLAYRAHENIFCKYFEAENLARLDCSADAKKNRIGIGLKKSVVVTVIPLRFTLDASVFADLTLTLS